MPVTANVVNKFVTGVVGRRFYGRPVARKAEAFARGELTGSTKQLGVH